MPKPSNVAVYALGMAVAVFTANYIIHWVTGFAPAYCWGKAVTMPLYDMWAQPAFTVCAIIFVVVLFLGRFILAAKMAIIMAMVASLPQFAYTLFALGSTCHA